MPKKKQRNSFYFYMQEKQELLSKQGRKLPMLEIANIAGPEWKKLSAAEKEKYELLAIQYKSQQRDYIGSKLASDGTSVQENLELEEEEKQKEIRMHSAVKDLITSCSRNKDLLARESFYVISFNILCRTEDDDFIPVEIGVLEYSIQKGLNRYYHKFIYPGTIPTGYTGEAKRHSEAAHQIPINGHEMADQNYQRILQELKNFIVPPEMDILPPFFCLNTELDQTVGCLRWLAEKSGQLCDVEIFKVWDLRYLLMELREATENGISLYLAHDLLHKNNFDYTPDTRCQYHEELDISYCALDRVRRLCFLLSDALCGVYDVEVTEKHLPVRAQEVKGYEMHIPLANSGPRKSIIKKAKEKKKANTYALLKKRDEVCKKNLQYERGRKKIVECGKKLKIPVTTVNKACELLLDVLNSHKLSGRLNMISSCCVSLACYLNRSTILYTDIAEYFLVKSSSLKTFQDTVAAELDIKTFPFLDRDFLVFYSLQLNTDPEILQIGEYLIEEMKRVASKEYKPSTVATISLILASEISGKKIRIEDACKVSPVAVKTAEKLIQEFRSCKEAYKKLQAK